MATVFFNRGDLVCFYAQMLEPLSPTTPPGRVISKEVCVRGRLLEIDYEGSATVRTMDGLLHSLPSADIYKLHPGKTTIR